MQKNQNIQFHRSAPQDAKPLSILPEHRSELVHLAREARGNTSHSLERQSVRLEIEPATAVLSVIHPGGTHTAAACLVYDIGPGGAAVLYPGFLYSAADCMLHMENASKEPAMLGASVAWCRFLGRGIHCVGLRWTDSVDVRRFVPSAMWSELGPSGDQQAQAQIRGRVLCIGISDLEMELIGVFLEDMPVELETAATPGSAIDALHGKSFDLLMIDGDNDEIKAEQLVSKLRQEGFLEPAILFSERRSLPTRDPDNGSFHIAKPLESEAVLSAVREITLAQSHPANGSGRIQSTLAGNARLHSAIESFVKHARSHMEHIRGGMNASCFDAIRRSVVLLHNTSKGFGFEILGDVAGEALKALDASGSAEEAAPQLKVLNRVIDRLDPPSNSPAA